MDDLIAPVIFLADRGVEFLHFEARAGRVGIAVNHPDDIGAVALAFFGIDVELDRVAGAQ